MAKTIMNYRDQSDGVSFVMKTKHDNDVTEHRGVMYVKNDTKLSWSID